MRITLAVLFSALLSTQSFAQNPDTTWVQTYTWEAQNNPATAYDSPGRRWFDFPASDNDTSYQKVLMYYNLKCFEDGTAGNLGYACGEWDYLTYTYLFDHTGMLDSNLLTHPHWLIDDLDFMSDTLVTEVAEVPVDTVRWTYTTTRYPEPYRPVKSTAVPRQHHLNSDGRVAGAACNGCGRRKNWKPWGGMEHPA